VLGLTLGNQTSVQQIPLRRGSFTVEAAKPTYCAGPSRRAVGAGCVFRFRGFSGRRCSRRLFPAGAKTFRTRDG